MRFIKFIIVLLIGLLFIGQASAACTTGGQTGTTINIGNCQNLTDLDLLVNNVTALQNLGSGEWLLNANLINNNTANTFYLNDSDVTWLKINSTNSSETTTYWYLKSVGKLLMNNTKITSWNVTSGNVEISTVSNWLRSFVHIDPGTGSSFANSNISYLGYSFDSGYGFHIWNGKNITILNITSIENYRGFQDWYVTNLTISNSYFESSLSHAGVISTQSNNNAIINTTFKTTSDNNYGLYINNANNTSLHNVTMFATTGMGLYLLAPNNTTVTNSNISATTGAGILFYNAKNTSIINGSITSASGWAYRLYISSQNNRINNTNFTTRKIYFEDNSSVFEYDNGVGVWLKTGDITSTGLTRTLINWNNTNISFSETRAASGQIQYNVSGLLPSSDYQIWNDTNIDFNYTTDANGVLTPFTINFTTVANTIKILQVSTSNQPNITSWSNNQTNSNSLELLIELFSNVNFNATANQSISTWNWFFNGTNQNNNYDNISYYFNKIGYYTIGVNATNTNGTSNTVQWNNTIKQAPEVNISMVIT